MSSVVIVGAQWGDEGKGKIVDVLSEQAEVVARFQGGDNAGHTVYCNDQKYVFHILPSGILRPKVLNVIGGGVVINPDRLLAELDEIGVPRDEWQARLLISGEAHLILPCHIALDRQAETRMGDGKIGTTLRGIGPAYADRAARVGVRMADVLDEDYFRARLRACYEAKRALLSADELGDVEVLSVELLDKLRPLAGMIGDTSSVLWRARAAGKHILYEGAQGAMLDVGAGSYPYVTSSHTIAGGVCVGAGVGPGAVDKVIGIAKAYATRVGEGPFPSELFGAEGDHLRELGGEYGATTKRPRRCGWIDLVQLKRAAQLNGMNAVALTKMDVLDDFEKIGVCVAYRVGDQEYTEMPVNPVLQAAAKPVFEFWPGWRAATSEARRFEDLPENARNYVQELERRLGVPITLVSAGRDRSQLIVREPVF